MTNPPNNDRKIKDSISVISSADLKYILDVNQKAIEIYLEVEKQNDQILDILKDFKEIASNIEDKIDDVSSDVRDLKVSGEKLKELIEDNNNLIESEIKSKISEIDKNLFRLVIILGSAGIGTIFTILQSFAHR